MNIFKRSMLFILATFTLTISTTGFAHNAAHLGKISFPTSGNAAAQPYFEKGVMFLHSFQYDDARKNFIKAHQIDQSFALAYWGEAMTYNHTIWSEQDYNAATAALNQLASTPAQRLLKTKDAREKGFINAINILYGKGNKVQRDSAYEDAMRELYRQYPDDDEIATFYALAILGTDESEREFKDYMRAAGIIEDVYNRNQLHPGALHYAIHAYDDPIHAPLGLRAARKYAKIAPDASHALHMPSHIYYALGMWDEVIQSNQVAWNAGLNENASKDPKAFTIHDLHALEWLSYAYLQKKNYSKAYELTKVMRDIARSANTPMAKWYYAMMRAAYISESSDFSADLPSFQMSDVELSAWAANIYANFLVAKSQNDIKKMSSELHALLKATPKAFNNKTYSDYFTSMTASGIKSARITALEIKAQIASMHHQNKAATESLKQAAKLEDDMSFGSGPPIPVAPSYELLGDILLSEGNYTDAYQQYIIALKRMPNRLISASGLEKAKQSLAKNNMPIPASIKPYFNRLMLPEFFH